VIGIVVSRADRASEHIGQQLLDRANWTSHTDSQHPDVDGGGEFYRRAGFELREFETIHVELDAPEAAFSEPDELEFVVFVSKHAGETGPLLTAHFTGNFGPAEYGGHAGSFARAAPGAQKAVIAALNRHAPDGYEVGIECTHHGPTAPSVPSLFVELGSTEKEWDDPEGAAAVADAVLDLQGVDADHRINGDTRHVVGFGGGHYTPRCTRIVDDSAWAVGHIGSEWQLDSMGKAATNKDVIEAAFEASAAELAVVDGDERSSSGSQTQSGDGENPEIEGVIDQLGYRVVSETWLRTVGERPVDVVDSLETELSTVDEGLRFGEVAVETDDWRLVSLPDELIAAAHAVDNDAVWSAVADHTVAFETVEGGTLPAGRAAIAAIEEFEAMVDNAVDLLESKYERIERTGEEIQAHHTSFDPQKATTLGIPEGPAFGKLAAGQPVEVNGRTIEPHVVEDEQVDRFPVSLPETNVSDR